VGDAPPRAVPCARARARRRSRCAPASGKRWLARATKRWRRNAGAAPRSASALRASKAKSSSSIR
jgi:hypothetical protein